MSSEDAFLAVLDQYFPSDLRGDDCAVLDSPSRLLVSTDLFFEDVHFRTRYFSPEEIGHKALAVNISDIAAMGGRPLGFSLGLGLPPNMDMGFFSALCDGMSTLAREFDLALSGGDLSAADKLLISVTIWGGAWHGRQPLTSSFLRRGVAQPGDLIFCVGPLGLARVGLALLEAQGREAIQKFPEACAAHLRPCPRVEEGRVLAAVAEQVGQKRRILTRRIGLMDVSDGLARDLPRLVGSGKGARIDRAQVPVHPEVAACAAANGLDPVFECLRGGEDYALAGSCPPNAAQLLKKACPDLYWLGTVTDAPGVFSDDRPLGAGFDHFR